MMNKNSPLSVKYYSYQVEFQLRGAAHIHGTIWIDFERYFEKEIEEESGGVRIFEKCIKSTSKKEKRRAEIEKLNQKIKARNADLTNEINAKVNRMNRIFDKLRNEELGEISEENEIMIQELAIC